MVTLSPRIHTYFEFHLRAMQYQSYFFLSLLKFFEVIQNAWMEHEWLELFPFNSLYALNISKGGRQKIYNCSRLSGPEFRATIKRKTLFPAGNYPVLITTLADTACCTHFCDLLLYFHPPLALYFKSWSSVSQTLAWGFRTIKRWYGTLGEDYEKMILL